MPTVASTWNGNKGVCLLVYAPNNPPITLQWIYVRCITNLWTYITAFTVSRQLEFHVGHASSPLVLVGTVKGGVREGGREGGREEGREGGREGGRRKGGREGGGRKGGREGGGREGGRGGREGARGRRRSTKTLLQQPERVVTRQASLLWKWVHVESHICQVSRSSARLYTCLEAS